MSRENLKNSEIGFAIKNPEGSDLLKAEHALAAGPENLQVRIGAPDTNEDWDTLIYNLKKDSPK